MLRPKTNRGIMKSLRKYNEKVCYHMQYFICSHTYVSSLSLRSDTDSKIMKYVTLS